jgi:hemoglobin-like flavoprotein
MVTLAQKTLVQQSFASGRCSMVTLAQKTLVQQSFAVVVPIAEDVTALFYQRLFEIDPSLRHLFAEDLRPQRGKLAQMLSAAVKGLDRPEQLLPVVQDLGRRHVGYGVAEPHYDAVGAALLSTLSRVLGPAFTPQVEDAWTAVYALLATTMKDAARSPAALA